MTGWISTGITCRLYALLLCCLAWQQVTAAPVLNVVITGVSGELVENVRAHLSLSRYAGTTNLLDAALGTGREIEAWPGAEQVRRLHRHAEREIRDALQPYGYYEPRIESTLEEGDERWTARYRIDAGTPVRVNEVAVSVSGEGEHDPGIMAVSGRMPLHPGDRLVHPDYDRFRTELQQAALDAGYLDAHYTVSELRVSPSTYRATVRLALETGPRYYFGPVSIEQDILAPGFVNRYVAFHEGEPFSTASLLNLQLALGDSGYFDQVDLDVRREAAQERRVPVVVHTQPAAHTRYRLGLGYDTDTGPRVTLGADFPRINRRGHGIGSELRVSPVEQTAMINYTVPFRRLLTDRIEVGAEMYNSTDVANTGNTRRYQLGISQKVSLGKLQRKLYFNLLHESFLIGTEADDVNFQIPGVTLSRLSSDSLLFPRRGYSWNLDLHGAPGEISATRFVRADAVARAVWSPGRRTRLLGRLHLGTIAVADFDKLPVSERFFAGGAQSVRGYDYQTLAPVDSSGQAVGGQYLSTGSLEAEYLFAGNYGAAVFVDAGNADDVLPPELKLGAGIGFRWRSPVGMVRIDLAHPFDDPDNSFRLHVSFGPDL